MMRLFNPLVDHVGTWLSPLRSRKFRFRQRVFAYCVRSYNRTWANERAIEIPLGTCVAKSAPAEEVLEIGNVLAHYGITGHTVIDKYEKHRRATNIDVMDFQPERRFSRVIAISTVEHVGWDESPKSREKAVSAVDKIKALLAPTGYALVTFPLGINHWLDSALWAGRWEDSEVLFMRRVSLINEWREVGREEAEFVAHGVPFPGANCIAVMLMGGERCGSGMCEKMFGTVGED